MKRIAQNGAQKEAKTEVERSYRPKGITKRRVGAEHRMTKPDDYLSPCLAGSAASVPGGR